MINSLVARQYAALHGLVLGGEFGHALLDGRQVLGREGSLVGEVVIEAVLDDRTDRHLRVRKQLLHGIGQQVRRAVANDLQAVGILVGDDGELRVAVDDVAGVDEPAVHAAGDGRLGQAGADGGRHLGHGNGAGELSPGPVRQRHVQHVLDLQKRKNAGVAALCSGGRGNDSAAAYAGAGTSAKKDVVRGVITRMPFSPLLLSRARILAQGPGQTSGCAAMERDEATASANSPARRWLSARATRQSRWRPASSSP